jgi:hypothetical protein
MGLGAWGMGQRAKGKGHGGESPVPHAPRPMQILLTNKGLCRALSMPLAPCPKQLLVMIEIVNLIK